MKKLSLIVLILCSSLFSYEKMPDALRDVDMQYAAGDEGCILRCFEDATRHLLAHCFDCYGAEFEEEYTWLLQNYIIDPVRGEQIIDHWIRAMYKESCQDISPFAKAADEFLKMKLRSMAIVHSTLYQQFGH